MFYCPIGTPSVRFLLFSRAASEACVYSDWSCRSVTTRHPTRARYLTLPSGRVSYPALLRSCA